MTSEHLLNSTTTERDWNGMLSVSKVSSAEEKEAKIAPRKTLTTYFADANG